MPFGQITKRNASASLLEITWAKPVQDVKPVTIRVKPEEVNRYHRLFGPGHIVIFDVSKLDNQGVRWATNLREFDGKNIQNEVNNQRMSNGKRNRRSR